MLNQGYIKTINRIVTAEVKPEQIWIFGSYAQGTAILDSDIDICIITSEKRRKIEIIRSLRRRLTQSLKFPLDILIYQPEEFRERAQSMKGIEWTVIHEGVRVYG